MELEKLKYAVLFLLLARLLSNVHRSPPNVLPLVNKGLALYQWKQDVGAAERCCNEALRMDPECEAAVATLAQLSLQQGKIEKAVEMFARQAELARSEPELASALTYQYVSALLPLRLVCGWELILCRRQRRSSSLCGTIPPWRRSCGVWPRTWHERDGGFRIIIAPFLLRLSSSPFPSFLPDGDNDNTYMVYITITYYLLQYTHLISHVVMWPTVRHWQGRN